MKEFKLSKTTIPSDIIIPRGQTQIGVNKTVLSFLLGIFSRDEDGLIKALDLPCGNMEFLTNLKKLFPSAEVIGADIVPPVDGKFPFVQMDLTKNFTPLHGKTFNLITSISGVMMFSNTKGFIENCVTVLQPGGTFILTNDNSLTIKDRLAYLFLGRYRLFNLIFEDNEALTENVPINELCRLLRTNGLKIKHIEYTSFYWKDLIYLPLVLFIYPIQKLYLNHLKTNLPKKLKGQLYPFKHLFSRHYIIVSQKF